MAHEVVAFARRPGRFAVAFSHHGTRAPLLFHPPEDRHFFGHGAFSPDGRLLYTSENDFEAGQGVIGIYEADAGYRRVGEFSAYGQGPHDLAVLNDGRTLVVAIGGLETHPDMGRHILNLSQMAPSLVYIDLVSGDLLEKVEFPKSLHQLSIRHLAVGEGERVVFGCQYKGPVGDRPPLMAAHKRGEEIKVMSAPDALLDRLKNYIGSVSVDQRGEVVAASAPRAGLVTYWRVRDGHFLAERRLEDGCGIAATNQPGQFLLTSGHGDVAFEGLHLEGAPVLDPGFQAQAHRQAAFDNHAVFVGLETG